MNTDTPRTEVFVNALETEYESCDVYKNKILLIDFSRQLERELLAEQEKVKRLREALQSISDEVGYTATANDWPKLHNVGIISRATLEATK